MRVVPTASSRPAAVNFIFVTVVLDMLALGMMAPVLPKLVLGFMHGDTAGASQVFGVLGTVWALMQFVYAPIDPRFGLNLPGAPWFAHPRSSRWGWRSRSW